MAAPLHQICLGRQAATRHEVPRWKRWRSVPDPAGSGGPAWRMRQQVIDLCAVLLICAMYLCDVFLTCVMYLCDVFGVMSFVRCARGCVLTVDVGLGFFLIRETSKVSVLNNRHLFNFQISAVSVVPVVKTGT